METQVRTPQMVFMQPQRLVVPLFQRPYVWNEENQWEPLWEDLVRVAERVLANPQGIHHPHFLGAVVLQQVQKQTGQMQERIIIDGQQRLTTLQLLLDALGAELHSIKALAPAMRIEPLVSNPGPFCSKPEDRFKVWPTNRDRPSFNATMGAEPPVNYETIGHQGERMVQAHRFFTERAREWLMLDGPETAQGRGLAIETVVRELLQVVVIDLAVDENAQEIFETLNARGAQLTSADLIKNFIFQRLLETDANVEEAYQKYWKEFETGFWETEIALGRLRYPRSAAFFNHWLIARTGEEIVAREVFDRFKRFADHESKIAMSTMLQQIHRAASVYRQFITTASTLTGPTSRLGLFGYRTGILESEVIKPLVLFLLDAEEPPIPEQQLNKTLDVIESWMVRRMFVRATTKSYSQLISELIALVRKGGRSNAGDLVEKYLAGQSSASRYWPDDSELGEELVSLLAYRRLGRGRLRMVLEAVEDYTRGWRNGQQGLGDERVARGKLAVEHVMPRKWQTHWPLQASRGEAERDRIIHTLGNLTLLTGKLNSKVSNGPWAGAGGKREALEKHDVLVLNRELLRNAGDQWADDAIRTRTQEFAKVILQIWRVPANHRSGFSPGKIKIRRKVDLSDLIAGGALSAGMTLFPRSKKFQNYTATLLADGRLEVDGDIFSSPTEAAISIAGSRNGWAFFLVDQTSRLSLRTVRRDYINAMAVDAEDDDPDDEGDDD